MLPGLLGGCDEVPQEALTAWRGPAPTLADERLHALAWALLAPSPHNAQPWRVVLEGRDRLLLRVDPARLLPVADPAARQTLIAHGAFLEVLALAAAARRRRAELTLLPEGDLEATAPGARPVARVRLTAATAQQVDPLFARLPQRRSTRLAYDLDKPVAAPDAEALRRAVGDAPVTIGFAVGPDLVAALRVLTWEAFRAEYGSPAALAETVRWLRLGAAEVRTRPDGLALTGRSPWWLSRLGLLSPEQLKDPGSLAWRMGLLQWDNLFAGTASFGWLTTPDDTTPSRVAAGRVYLRVDLAAAAVGVAIHPVSQALEGLPGTLGPKDRLERLLGVQPPARVQMLFRLGYAGPQPPSPRRPLRAILES